MAILMDFPNKFFGWSGQINPVLQKPISFLPNLGFEIFLRLFIYIV